ncbi:hypothetical protein [Mycolicibacterium sp.]|uniref:hypothetical protein n=1 Tax=Mycolicibacterium sp. TaxID=2320850 RepID=UPI0028B0D61F|nr:hypothetical protein [Mycolicibacterium sp.]
MNDSTTRESRPASVPSLAPQSLSPFESHTTTMIVWWSTLVISTTVLLVCWTLWI